MVIDDLDGFWLYRMLNDDLASCYLHSGPLLREVLFLLSRQPLQLLVMFVFAYMSAGGISFKYNQPGPIL